MDISILLKPLAYIFILCLGILLRTLGFIKDGDHRLLSFIVIKITLPAAIIRAFSQVENRDPTLYWIVLLGLFCTVVPLFVTYAASRKMDKNLRIYSMINMSGYNIGCFALPLIQSFFGAPGAVVSCMFDVGNTVMSTSGAYAVTSTLLGANPSEPPTVKTMLKKFATSVPLIACVIMLVLNIFEISTPEIVSTIVDPIASANSFLAMFMVGAMFKLDGGRGYISTALKLVGTRLAFCAVFAALTVLIAPFDPMTKRVLAMLIFAPIASIAPAYTDMCGADGALASFTNSLSTAISLIIMLTLAVIPL